METFTVGDVASMAGIDKAGEGLAAYQSEAIAARYATDGR